MDASGGSRQRIKVAVTLTPTQRRQLETRAREEHRSVSNYVAAVIVGALGER